MVLPSERAGSASRLQVGVRVTGDGQTCLAEGRLVEESRAPGREPVRSKAKDNLLPRCLPHPSGEAGDTSGETSFRHRCDAATGVSAAAEELEAAVRMTLRLMRIAEGDRHQGILQEVPAMPRIRTGVVA